MTDTIRTAAGTPARTLKPDRLQPLAGSWRVDPQASHAGSIDTGNGLRDRHLRSGDFFNVDKHPELRYTVRALTTQAPHTIRIDGELVVAGTRTPLALDASLRALTLDVIELGCRIEVDRIVLGVRGARGVVPRTVRGDVRVVLRREIIARREG
jgi:polyisoprenoid-binding protein YceI